MAQVTPFCAACGKPISDDAVETYGADTPTLKSVPKQGTPRKPISRPSSHSFRNEGRFAPGVLVAERYRIVALLGKGGMGEVYRADDLSLGQPVALKFLPEFARSDETLERFRHEVRIARRISHPNVCRVFDIGQTDDLIFFTMEYIDGEDLASLLRRIGRLPGDKAAEIARKICAGVAAAHDKGVLHRDLKPANVMLDGRGEVLITDFGLAGVAHEIEDVRSGTPAYMSPEQLAGEEVTVKSDIYSLGLLLYEVFTGKAAFDGRTLEEIVRVRRDSTPSRPSSLVKDLDPAVEHVILHCLESDPRARPASALAVAAALPGGDPLAAALAAGETPSPQMVAAAGETTGLKLPFALGWLGVAILGLLAFYLLAARTSGIQRMNVPYSAEILNQKARDLVQQLGYTAPPADSADGFVYDDTYLEYLHDNPKLRTSWDAALRGRPPAMIYWLRESPSEMVATEVKDALLTPGIVDLDDPPPILSGMVQMSLDSEGRLYHLEAIPPQKDTSPGPFAPVDWSVLFRSAGLDQAQLQSAAPMWNSLAASDTRAAWTGTWPGTNYPLRVEAASYRGKPVYFSLIGDWTEPNRMVSSDESFGKKVWTAVLAVCAVLMLFAAVLIAWRNYVREKADMQGAWRLGIVIFSLQMLQWLFRAHFVPSIASLGLFVLAASSSLFLAAVVCALYLAIEPYVRRRWPHAIISWSRLMAGQVRDPLLGRDTLYGVLLGVGWALIFSIFYLLRLRAGDAPALGATDYLLGARHVLGSWLWHLDNSVQGTLLFFFVMFLLRVILRKPWLAALAFVAVWTAIKTAGSHHLLIDVSTFTAIYAIAAFVVLRFGFIALATGIFTVNLLLNIPITTHLSSWYLGGSLFVLLTVIGLAVWGCYTALAGQKIWKESLFE
ncbi:MAG: serine/threonine-protein kinase [Candidatus Korobacteraceae bacterium]